EVSASPSLGVSETPLSCGVVGESPRPAPAPPVFGAASAAGGDDVVGVSVAGGGGVSAAAFAGGGLFCASAGRAQNPATTVAGPEIILTDLLIDMSVLGWRGLEGGRK